ncbi:MAG: PEP-CTERM sorting domain-containing protein [Terriglobia bacterium]
MKKRFLVISAMAAALVMIGPGLAHAGNVTLTINNAGSNTMGGVYVGPYNFTLTAANGQTSSLQLICDDANDDVHPPGESWQFTTEDYSNLPSSLNGAKFSPDAIGYQEVGYLSEELLANLSDTTEVGEIQWAIWDVFDTGTCGTGISNCDHWGSLTSAEITAINSYLGAAQANYASGNYSNLVIYTPVAGTQVPPSDGPPQEYIDTAAEPSSILLLGLVLFGFLAARRFRYAV